MPKASSKSSATTARPSTWRGALLGAGGIIGHFWHNIPKDTVNQMGDLLEDGQSGLVVVAVNRKGHEIEPLLANTEKKTVIDTVAGDLESAYGDALMKEKAAQSRRHRH